MPDDKRNEALDRIIAEGLTLRQTEEYIFDILNPAQEPDDAPDEPVRKAVIGDVRLFSNSLSKLVTTLRNAGINANSRKYETDNYIEFKVRIPKNAPAKHNCTQLKIC